MGRLGMAHGVCKAQRREAQATVLLEGRAGRGKQALASALCARSHAVARDHGGALVGRERGGMRTRGPRPVGHGRAGSVAGGGWVFSSCGARRCQAAGASRGLRGVRTGRQVGAEAAGVADGAAALWQAMLEDASEACVCGERPVLPRVAPTRCAAAGDGSVFALCHAVVGQG
jgi:hypothetical protein